MPSVIPATIAVSRFDRSASWFFRFDRDAARGVPRFDLVVGAPVLRFASMRVPSRRSARGRSR
jgi:hypothetical protein